MPTTSSYQPEPLDGGAVRFHVTAAEKRLPVFRAVIVGMCIGVVPALFLAIPGFIAGTVAGFFIFRAAAAAGDRRKRGGDSIFTASPAGLERAGTAIPIDRIHRLVMRNVFSGQTVPYSNMGIIAGGTGLVGGAVIAAAASVNMATSAVNVADAIDRKQAADVGYKLDVEFQGKALTLAGGMTETTAYGLMQEVGNVLWGR